MYDVIILGGGIVGASIVYHFVRRGYRTLLIDRDDPGRATNAGAGIVSPEMDSTESDAWYQMALDAKKHYGDLVDRLATDGIIETGFERSGILLVDRQRDDVPDFETVSACVRKRVERAGSPNELREVRSLDNDDELPPLSGVRRALYYEDAARVRGSKFRRALLAAAKDPTLDIIQEDAISISIEDGEATGVVTDEQQYIGGSIVIAGGAWSARFGAQLGIEIPVRPERGQIVHLKSADADSDNWPIINTLSGEYFVPWSNGRLVVGATHEKGVGYDLRVTANGVHTLLDTALRTIPILGKAELVDVRVGFRPVSRDGLPIIGSVPGVTDAYVATGHGSTGLLLGPYTGKLVADMITDEKSSVDLSAFTPARFV